MFDFQDLSLTGSQLQVVLFVLLFSFSFALLMLVLLCKELFRRRAVKQELRNQLAFQQALLENMPYAVCVRDTQARLVSCNTALEKLFGIPRERLLGKNLIESGIVSLDEGLVERAQARLIAMLSDLQPISDESDIVVDGATHHVLHWGAPICLKPGDAACAMVTGAIDVTERHQLLKEIEAALNQAEAANRAKSNFLATMSHEIRTPMNAVLGMLELLVREGRLNRQDHESAELARKSGQSLLGLIDDVLDISKIEAGGLEIVPVPARLPPIIEDVAKMFSGLARQRGLALELDLDPAVGEWYMVDPVRFKQIVNNLVSNAIKYTDAGSITLRLRHGKRVGDRESVVVEVQDTGIGIAPADVVNLFRPFFQAESAGPRVIGGTGLGLPIVQRLCVMMGGRIEVLSECGLGTCIRLSFSFATATEPVAMGSAAGVSGDARGNFWRRGSHRVLAVDDHPANRLLLQRQLEHLGLDCDLAEEGERALALWREGGYSLVITDCSMPIMDGYALTAAIRELERGRGLPRCPVLGCTAHVGEEERRHALKVGMDECLTKPLSLDGLSAVLLRYLPADVKESLPAATIKVCAEASPEASHRATFDPLMLQSLSDGDAEVEARFLEKLLQTNLSDMQEIAQRVQSGDDDAVASIAHKIKGAARLVRAERVIRSCEALERACREGQMQTPSVVFPQLIKDLDEFNRSIKVRMADLAATANSL